MKKMIKKNIRVVCVSVRGLKFLVFLRPATVVHRSVQTNF